MTFSIGAFREAPIQIREVLFVDTADFRPAPAGDLLRARERRGPGRRAQGSPHPLAAVRELVLDPPVRDEPDQRDHHVERLREPR